MCVWGVSKVFDCFIKLLFVCFTQTEYLELADQLSAYVVKLLDKVRGHDELEIVINKTGRDSELETYERLSRFKLAIRYNEKKVGGFVVMVLDKVRGHDELEIVINKTGRDSELETYERLSRFKLAIRYNEKKVSDFVAMVLDKVKGRDYLEGLIKKTGRYSELESYKNGFSRFKLAIRYNEKKVSGFVAMVLDKVTTSERSSSTRLDVIVSYDV